MKLFALAACLLVVATNATIEAEKDEEFCPGGKVFPITPKTGSAEIRTCGWGLNKHKPVKDWTKDGMLKYGDKVILNTTHHDKKIP